MLKSVVALAAALAFGAASADTPLTLVQDQAGTWSASFAGLTSGDNTFTFDLSGPQFAGWTDFVLLPLFVTASSARTQGYNITNVTFDGVAIDAEYDEGVPGVYSLDVWTWADFTTSGPHSIVVSGNLLGGNTGFTGSMSVYAQPVPEPESYALMLAGLAGIGAILRRRSSR